jgi:predicted Zn-dependent protease
LPASSQPDNPAILFASANAARAAGAEREAGRLYRQLLLHEPEFYAARNNYADLLLHAGCRDQAQRVFEPLREVLSDLPGSLGDAVRDTEKAIREAASPKACSMPEAAGDDRRPDGEVIPAEEAMSRKVEAYSA